MPITWRNVDAPNFSAANDLLNQGANRLTSSLTGIGTQLDERVDRQKDVWDQTKEANTEQYLGQISGATDLDAVANLRASLTPEYMKENYGNQIDLRTVNTALQDQGRFVRQDAKETIQHENLLMDQSSRDIRGQIQAAYASGDLALGDRLKQEALAAGEIHGDHVSDLVDVRTRHDDRMFNRKVKNTELSLTQQRLGMEQRSLAIRESEFAMNMDRLREAKNKDQRTSILTDSAINYAAEFGNTEEGKQAFLSYLNSLDGVTGEEKINANNLWNQALAKVNDVPEDVQVRMNDASTAAREAFQKDLGVDLAAERRALEREEKRFESESNAPYMRAYQEADVLLSDARQRIIDSQDHSWWRGGGERAAAENVIADMERIRTNVQRAILSDPSMAGKLAPFNDKIPDGVMALAMSKVKVSRNSKKAHSDFDKVLRNELDAFIRVQNEKMSYQERKDNYENLNSEADRVAQEASQAVQSEYRLRTYNTSYRN